ncbi:tetratricopeptide repeat protein [Streptomyces albidoflavus]|uniref:tetratricopeptide repeat protein n=1 Tax=Streptomyces albidoflavus TaxID=1886 RepID=UPI0033B4216A
MIDVSLGAAMSMALLYEQALQELGPTDPATWERGTAYARRLMKDGLFDDAVEVYRDVLAGRRSALGADHPDALATGHSLASPCGRAVRTRRPARCSARSTPRGGVCWARTIRTP